MMALHPSGRVARRTRSEVEAIVLDSLREAKVPLGAYEIIEHAAAVGSRLVPAQVYRTLGRLVDRHRVHCVASLSGYIIADGPVDCLSICTICQHVVGQPAPHLLETLRGLGRAAGLSACSATMEVLGLCSECRAARTDGSASSRTRLPIAGGAQ